MPPLPRVCTTKGLDRLIRKSALCVGVIVLSGLTPAGRADERLSCPPAALTAMPVPAGAVELVDMPEAFTPGKIGKVRVKVSNTDAGQELATGSPDGREVWIDLRLIDATGREFYRLGAIRDGRTEPGTRNFRVLRADTDGRRGDVKAWKVARILSEKPILHNGQAVEEFSFAVPANAVGPITVRADLNYWPFPQKLADVILGPNKLGVEVTRIASAASQVPLSRIRPKAVEEMERLLLLLAVGRAR